MEDQKTNQIAVVAKESGLQPTKVDELLKSFAGYFGQAKELAEAAKSIVVTDESQTDLMIQARESRLKLKAIRVEVEKTRKELKEQSLREGKAIDGVSNLIKALIVPVEEHLEKQEKYAEIRELERIQARYEDRITRLTPYVEDISLYNIKDMSDDAFEKLLESSIAADKAKKEAEAKAEADRLAEEKRQKLFNDRRLELAPYRDFIDGAIPLLDMSEEDYQTLLSKVKDAKKNHDAEQEKIRKENEELRKKAEAKEKAAAEERRIAEEKRAAERKAEEEKLEKERRAREEAEAKLKAEKEAQAKKEAEARAAEEAKKKADEEAKRQALLAPDKDKLNKLAADLDSFKFPAVESQEAGELLRNVRGRLDFITNLIREKAKTLWKKINLATYLINN